MQDGSEEKGKGQRGGVRCYITSSATNCLMRVNKTMIPEALLFGQSEFEAQIS
jgi:hypothetical protein